MTHRVFSYGTLRQPEVQLCSSSDLRRGEPHDRVQGACLELTEAELAATDRYEVEDYARRTVTLESGVEAWAYLAQDEA